MPTAKEAVMNRASSRERLVMRECSVVGFKAEGT
jgi:hypothetical protein